jgi:DNA-binding Xre family transcriptional regulator
VAVTRSGYANQRALADDTGLSLATVSNFLTGKPVNYRTVEELCRKLNLDWQEITTSSDEVISTPPPQSVQIRKKKTISINSKTGEQQLIFHHFTDARKN